MNYSQDFINKVICDNCFNILPLLPDKCCDLIIIDPPYFKVTSEKWDKIEVVNDVLSKELFRIAKDSCSLYVWCGIGEKSQSLIRWFPIFSKDWYFKDLITWKKQRGIGMRKGWLYTREEIMWFVKDNKNFIWNEEFQYGENRRIRDLGKDVIKPSQSGKFAKSIYKRLSNVWDDISEESFNVGNEIKHFTPKPLKTLERIIKLHTKENDLILDCFAGSGSTGLAAKNLNCQFILIEKEQKYYDIILERLKI